MGKNTSKDFNKEIKKRIASCISDVRYTIWQLSECPRYSVDCSKTNRSRGIDVKYDRGEVPSYFVESYKMNVSDYHDIMDKLQDIQKRLYTMTTLLQDE